VQVVLAYLLFNPNPNPNPNLKVAHLLSNPNPNPNPNLQVAHLLFIPNPNPNLQVAYAHLLFNLTGIFIWYTIWPLRFLPIMLAKHLGNTVRCINCCVTWVAWHSLLASFVTFFASLASFVKGIALHIVCFVTF
jgi:hypothetical protein